MPPANGRWDKAHRRALFVDDGDIVMVDADRRTTGGSRRHITRTTGGESNPRWARNDTHVTYVRDGNLFIVPVDGSGAALVTQLTDVAPKRAEPRLTDSQKFLRDEEEKLIGFVREQKEQKKKDEEKAKKDKLPAFELQDRQTAVGPDALARRHARLRPRGRAAGRREERDRPELRHRDRLHRGHPRTIERRRHAGSPAAGDPESQDRQDGVGRRQLRAAGRRRREAAADGATGRRTPGRKKAEREIRWSMPVVSDDGKLAVASARSARQQGSLARDPRRRRPARRRSSTRSTTTRGSAKPGRRGHRAWSSCPTTSACGSSRSATAGCTSTRSTSPPSGAKPAQLTSGKWEVTAAELSRDGRRFYITTTEVHPGERQLYTLPIDGGARTKLTSMTGSNAAEVSPDDSTLGLVYSYSNKPPEVFVAANRPGAPATAGHDDADRRVAVVQLDRSAR